MEAMRSQVDSNEENMTLFHPGYTIDLSYKQLQGFEAEYAAQSSENFWLLYSIDITEKMQRRLWC